MIWSYDFEDLTYESDLMVVPNFPNWIRIRGETPSRDTGPEHGLPLLSGDYHNGK